MNNGERLDFIILTNKNTAKNIPLTRVAVARAVVSTALPHHFLSLKYMVMAERARKTGSV